MRSFPTDFFFDQAFKADSTNNAYNAFDEDIAVVNFFFNRPTAQLVRRRPSRTPTVFFSEVGGIFGLCLGCSLISGLEVIYWLLVRGFCLVTKTG